MAQVSIADVDNLTDACDALLACLASAQDVLKDDSAELVALMERTTEMVRAADRALEDLRALEVQQKTLLEELESELAVAQDDLASAEADLSAADEDERESAETEVNSCRSAVAEAEAECRAAEAALVETAERRRKQEEVLSMASMNDLRTRQLQESFCAAQRVGVASVEHQVQVAVSRLREAQQALNEYLATHPSEAAFVQWVHWSPAPGQPVTPKDICDRLHLTPSQQQQLTQYLYYRDPVFRAKIDSYRERYETAKGGAERDAVLVQASRGGSGDLAERMVKFAFSPIGTVSTQDRRYVEGEHYTKIDLVVTDIKNPVILGRGKGMGAPVGGSLAIEVKSGHPNYLYAQKGHMRFQAAGHQDSTASIVICSEDIHDLPEEQERELRDALRTAGSPIVGMLPRKDDLDAMVWNLIASKRSTE